MNRVRPHAAIALAAAAALVVLVAGPASAVTPDGTAVLTVTSDHPGVEDTTATITGDCPATTTHAVVNWDWTDGSGPQNMQSTFVAASFSAFYYFSNFVSRGQVISFTLSCVDGADVELATANKLYTQPDFGQTLSIPATVATNADIMATVNCPIDGANSLFVTQFRGDDTLTPAQWVTYTGPGTYNFGTPAAVGAAVGDAIDVLVECVVTGDGNVYASKRIARYSAVAPATTVIPETPVTTIGFAGPGGGSLAQTGAPLGWMSAMAAAIAMAGVALTFTSRARRAQK